jgi:hypothetical protein
MDKTALLTRRRRLQRQRDAELRACRAKWRSRINAVDRLLRIGATAGAARARPAPSQGCQTAVYAKALNGNMKGGRKEGVMKLLRHILDHKRGFFTATMLVDLINKAKPFSVTKHELSHRLGSLRLLGEIKLVDRGGGRKPHMYLKL